MGMPMVVEARHMVVVAAAVTAAAAHLTAAAAHLMAVAAAHQPTAMAAPLSPTALTVLASAYFSLDCLLCSDLEGRLHLNV